MDTTCSQPIRTPIIENQLRIEAVLWKANGASMIPLPAIIDTGATHSRILPFIAETWGYRKCGKIRDFGPNREPQIRDTYLIKIGIPITPTFLFVKNVEAGAMELVGQLHEVLIGMDILNELLLTVNGPEQWFTLERLASSPDRSHSGCTSASDASK